MRKLGQIQKSSSVFLWSPHLDEGCELFFSEKHNNPSFSPSFFFLCLFLPSEDVEETIYIVDSIYVKGDRICLL